jgi:predicted RNA-binding protein
MAGIQLSLGDKADVVHVCTYAAPFGVVPMELDDIYPVSQNMVACPFDDETVSYVAKQVADYIKKTSYERIILLQEPTVWRGKIAAACRQTCKKRNVPFIVLREKEPWAEGAIAHLNDVLREAVASS